MVLLFQCKYRCVKLNMLKLAPKTEQDSNGTFHQGAFLLPRWPPGHLKAHICFDRCGFLFPIEHQKIIQNWRIAN